MENAEVLQLIHRCTSEIKDLRKQIDYLQPKAEAYDALLTVLRMVPHGGTMGMGEDLVRLLDRKVRDIEAEEARKKAAEEAATKKRYKPKNAVPEMDENGVRVPLDGEE